MKQRVAIARTLINRPRLVLMDEPFGALDPQTRWGMQSLLLDVSRTEDNTMLFVTHDVSEAVYLADAIYVLSNRPARDSSPRRRAVFSRPRRRPEVGGRVPRRREAAARPPLRAPAALHVECDRMSAPEKPSSARPTPPATPRPTPPRTPDPADGLGHPRHRGGFREERALRQAPVSEVRVQQPVQPVALRWARSPRPASRSTRCSRSRRSAPRRSGCSTPPTPQRLQHLLWDPQFEQDPERDRWSRSVRSA